MSFLAVLRRGFIWLKVYAGRSQGYISFLNVGMILFLFLSKLKETGNIIWEIDKYVFPIYFIGFMLTKLRKSME